jgi:hypothetical protein
MSRSQLTFTPSFFRGVGRVGIPPTSIYILNILYYINIYILFYIYIKYLYITYYIYKIMKHNKNFLMTQGIIKVSPEFDSAWVYPRPRWQRRASRPPWCPPTPDGLVESRRKNPAVVMVSWWKVHHEGFHGCWVKFFLEFDDFDGSLLPKKSRIDCFLTRKVGKPTWRRSCFDMKGGILTRKND